MKNNYSPPDVKFFLREYLKARPLFLSLTRIKEAELFQKYLPLKRPVLDVGCGDGFFVSVACRQQHGITKNKRGYTLIDVGLDVEGSRVAEARKLGVYNKIISYDGKIIPFKNESFSTVISNCVLEHIPDLSFTISEIYRVLKKGGVFITTVATNNWEEYLLGNLLLGNIYKKWMRKKQVHYNLLTSKKWMEIFAKHGFSIIREIGYLDEEAVRMIDLFHYLCLPNLFSYKIFGKWVLWPKLTILYPRNWLSSYIEKNITIDNSACIFFVLKK